MNLTRTSRVALLVAAAFPFITFAQTVSTIPNLFLTVIGWINQIFVPLIFAIAFVAFLVGIYYYFIQNGANPEKAKEGRTFLVWSLIGFFVMFSVWGLVNLFVGTFGFNYQLQPNTPQFNVTNSTSNNPLSSFTSSSNTSGSYLPAGSTLTCSGGVCPSGCISSDGGNTCRVSQANTVFTNSTSNGGSSNTQSCGDGTPAPSGNVNSCVQCQCGSSSDSAGDCSDYCATSNSSNASGAAAAGQTCTDGSAAPANDASLCTECDCGGATSSSGAGCNAYCGDSTN